MSGLDVDAVVIPWDEAQIVVDGEAEFLIGGTWERGWSPPVPR